MSVELRGMWSEQRAWSRNLGESWGTFARRAVWSVRYWLTGVRVGLGALRHDVVGSRVRFEGSVWEIANWSYPSPSATLARGDERREHVLRSEFRPIVSPRELWHRFWSQYSWWMGYWHCIHVNQRLGRRQMG